MPNQLRRTRRLSREQLDDIAKTEGFPNFINFTEGFGRPAVYSNEDNSLCRVYDIRTGKPITTYSPSRNNKSAIKFNNPQAFNPDSISTYRTSSSGNYPKSIEG